MWRALTVLVLSSTWAVTAWGQSCHTPPPTPLDDESANKLGLQASLRVEAAAFRTGRFEGDYQGLVPRLQWETARFAVRTEMPFYRLLRNGAETAGAGDGLLAGQVVVLGDRGKDLSAGAGVVLTLPTGSADSGLGMGHPMLMSHLSTMWNSDIFYVRTEAGYGRALAPNGAAHHAGGPAPLVNPMNASEVEFAASGGVLVLPRLRTRAALYGAVPVFTDGAARMVTSLGVDWLFEGFEVGIDILAPLVGDPFLIKGTLNAAVRF